MKSNMVSVSKRSECFYEPQSEYTVRQSVPSEACSCDSAAG